MRASNRPFRAAAGCRILAPALFALAVGPAAADQAGVQVKAAQVAALVEVAPTVCPDLAIKPTSLQRWLARAGLTQADIADRYGEPARRMAQSFLATVRADRAMACSMILRTFGDDGLGLLMRRPALPD